MQCAALYFRETFFEGQWVSKNQCKNCDGWEKFVAGQRNGLTHVPFRASQNKTPQYWVNEITGVGFGSSMVRRGSYKKKLFPL